MVQLHGISRKGDSELDGMNHRWHWPGSRWWHIDLHAHSPASGDFNRPNPHEKDGLGWVEAAARAKLDAIAITRAATCPVARSFAVTTRGHFTSPIGSPPRPSQSWRPGMVIARFAHPQHRRHHAELGARGKSSFTGPNP